MAGFSDTHLKDIQKHIYDVLNVLYRTSEMWPPDLVNLDYTLQGRYYFRFSAESNFESIKEYPAEWKESIQRACEKFYAYNLEVEIHDKIEDFSLIYNFKDEVYQNLISFQRDNQEYYYNAILDELLGVTETYFVYYFQSYKLLKQAESILKFKDRKVLTALKSLDCFFSDALMMTNALLQILYPALRVPRETQIEYMWQIPAVMQVVRLPMLGESSNEYTEETVEDDVIGNTKGVWKNLPPKILLLDKLGFFNLPEVRKLSWESKGRLVSILCGGSADNAVDYIRECDPLRPALQKNPYRNPKNVDAVAELVALLNKD